MKNNVKFLLISKILDDPVRGGYCYELNGAFHWLLKNLGYQVLYTVQCTVYIHIIEEGG